VSERIEATRGRGGAHGYFWWRRDEDHTGGSEQEAIRMPGTMSQSMSRPRTLAVAQALVLLVALGAPIAALAAVNSVSPSSLAQGATSQPVTITGSGFEASCDTYSVTFSGSGVSATGVALSSATQMTANVTVTAGAAVGLRDVTASGSGTCAGFSFVGIDAFSVTAGAGTATKLAITSISPPSPTVDTAFSVVVQSQDASGNPTNVTSTTGVSLSLDTGTGTLGGTLTGSIVNGANSVTISGVTYSKVETGVRLTAARTSGMSPLAAGTSAAFTVVAGTFTKLQVLVPGEIAAPGTTSGKTGTPTAQTAGTPFTVTVNAVDANWNVMSSTHRVRITASDANATLPANAHLVAGTRTFSVTLNTVGSWTVTATDITDTTKTANTSAAIAVNAGTFTKLQVLVPGEIAAPGTASGKTGTPSIEGAGAPFTVTVNAVDAQWNVVSSTHTVAISSSDPAANLPASAALVAGTRTFSVTLNTVGSRTVTATDLSDAIKTARTSAAITVVAPTMISLTRSRGMITYGESDIFSVQFGTGGANRPFVLEYTSVGVPWTTIANLVTNASGFASLTYVPTRTGYVRARFVGATDLGAATSGVYIVGVRQTVSTLSPHHAGTKAIARGTSVTFTITVRPLRPDLAPSMVTFGFYQKVSGAWVLKIERHVATDTVGIARTTFAFGSAGSWYVRAYAPRTPYNSISRFTLREYYLVQ
jgi:predicted RNA methylase